MFRPEPSYVLELQLLHSKSWSLYIGDRSLEEVELVKAKMIMGVHKRYKFVTR